MKYESSANCISKTKINGFKTLQSLREQKAIALSKFSLAPPQKKMYIYIPLATCLSSNQIFYYTRCIAPKRVKQACWAHLCVIARGKHSSFQRNVTALASRRQRYVRFDRPEI